ncbi:uncharacterized protein LOC133191560 [Saccostrea echinata]|uniref:uncharacterized protein LOC133191560 n=1 Tax=Saccostrea echinata TaxID=191078 RepID=UPI002A83E386|nr:uncharacterized protein LOC133191560 [Saccostrea echinata]
MIPFISLYFVSSLWIANCQKIIRVNSYDSLVSSLANGADVRYFFNISMCMGSSTTTKQDIPVFGGDVKMFVASKNSDMDTGETIFSQARYIDDKTIDLNEEIQTIWIINDTALIFWGRPGFFVNNTADIDGMYCNWTRGEGNIWIKKHTDEKQLTSFKEIHTVLTSGGEVRWVANLAGCKCPPAPDDCNDASIGDTIKDFKIMTDGSISFSTSMTFYLPLSVQYVRLITFGHIYENNTANFMVSYLDPTTWKDEENDMIQCPIAPGPSVVGANFFYH